MIMKNIFQIEITEDGSVLDTTVSLKLAQEIVAGFEKEDEEENNAYSIYEVEWEKRNFISN